MTEKFHDTLRLVLILLAVCFCVSEMRACTESENNYNHPVISK